MPLLKAQTVVKLARAHAERSRSHDHRGVSQRRTCSRSRAWKDRFSVQSTCLKSEDLSPSTVQTRVWVLQAGRAPPTASSTRG
jgi:hypothetical protein